MCCFLTLFCKILHKVGYLSIPLNNFWLDMKHLHLHLFHLFLFFLELTFVSVWFPFGIFLLLCQVSYLFKQLCILLLDQSYFKNVALCPALQRLNLLLRIFLECHKLLHRVRRLLFKEVFLLHFLAQQILCCQHFFDVLLIGVFRVLSNTLGVPHPSGLLLQMNALLVEFKIFVLELFDLYRLVVVLSNL